MSLIETKSLPPIVYLRSRFAIADDGGLIWLNGHKRGKRAGTIARNSKPGEVKLDGRVYIVSRIVFYMATGIDPIGKLIDHIDGNQNNNRPSNLRLATREQNMHNRRFKNNRLGARHVYWVKRERKWIVLIGHNLKLRYFGKFDDFDDANKVAAKARIDLYGEFSGGE